MKLTNPAIETPGELRVEPGTTFLSMPRLSIVVTGVTGGVCEQGKSMRADWMTGMIRLLIAMMLLVVVDRASAQLTYMLDEYPAYQISNQQDGSRNYNLTGTITTDGTLGALAAGNILSWQYSSAAADGNRTIAFSSSDASAVLAIAGTVIATETEIQIPRFATIQPSVINQLSLQGRDITSGQLYALIWQTGAFLTFPLLSEQFGFAGRRATPLGDPWLASSTVTSPLNLPQGTGSIVVATVVPEPSTWVMTLAGIACAGWYAHRRCKRA